MEEIAIIGVFQVKFWQNLQDGVESVSVFTDEKLISTGISDVLSDPHYVRAGAIRRY